MLLISIWPQNSKMAVQTRKTNITGLVINLQSKVICQNVCFLNINANTLLYNYDFYDFDIATEIQNGRQELLNKHK